MVSWLTQESARGEGGVSLNKPGVERPGGIHGRGFQASWQRYEQVLAETENLLAVMKQAKISR
jgi:hypothetical protein